MTVWSYAQKADEAAKRKAAATQAKADATAAAKAAQQAAKEAAIAAVKEERRRAKSLAEARSGVAAEYVVGKRKSSVFRALMGRDDGDSNGDWQEAAIAATQHARAQARKSAAFGSPYAG